MPANLNALIRYKTINSCLYGGRRKWSIGELIDACSDALAEARGRYSKLSERTIRDDIRIMRSDILGFNAPIRQEHGLYFYADPAYSIMAVGITDPELFATIIRLLLDLRGKIAHPELEIILGKLLEISAADSAIVVPEKYLDKHFNAKFDLVSDSLHLKEPERIQSVLKEDLSQVNEFEKQKGIMLTRKVLSRFEGLSWGAVLGLLGSGMKKQHGRK